MKPLRTREELLDMAAHCAPTAAVGRRIREDGATVFRGVTSPEGFVGYVVKSRDRLIGIWCDTTRRKWICSYPQTLPDGAQMVTEKWL